MTRAKAGDRVTVHYTGTLADGTEFDSSHGSDPFTFTLGEDPVVPGLQAALIGMAVGEKKHVEVTPEYGYGPRNEALVSDVDRTDLPPGTHLAEGQIIRLRGEDRAIVVTVSNVRPDKVTLDANHPLAGKDLVFDVELVAIG